MLTLDFSVSLVERDRKAGFTLLEMIVSVAILAILGGIVLGYSQGSKSAIELASNESKLLGLLFNAKSLSQSFIFNPPANKQLCAYGVHVDTGGKKIFVFQDLVADTEDCDADTDNSFTTSDPEEKFLENTTNIFYLSDFLRFGSATNLDDVVFIPPDPSVIINNDPTSSSDPSQGTKEALIVIEAKDDPDLKFTIEVNHFGQISVQ